MSNPEKTCDLIDGKYRFLDLIDAAKLENYFTLFTGASGFTASIILYPDHQLLIKSGCRKLCTELQCIDPDSAGECVTEDLLLDSEIRETSDLTLRISSIGLADGALPIFVKGVHAANIISGHVFFEKPDMEKLVVSGGNRNLDDYLRMVGGIQNIPVVSEEALKASLFLLRDITVLIAEQTLNILYENDIRESLRKSEKLFRGIANSIPGVVYQFYARPDGDMGLYYVSEQSMNILGLDNNVVDFYPRILRLIAPEYSDNFILSVSEAVSECKMWQFESRIITPDGTEKYILGISYPERSGDEIIFNGVMLDVTARRKIEDAFRESEARYREIFENASVGIYQSLPAGHYLIVNRAFADMAGYESPEQMISEVKDIAGQLYALPAQRENIKKILSERGFFRDVEMEFKKRNGELFWASISGSAAKDGKGDIAYFHGTAIDITDRKNAENALRLSEERYRMISDFTGQLTYDRDMVRHSIQWAGQSYDIIGYSIDKLQSMKVNDLINIIHPEDRDRVKSEYVNARNERRIFSTEYRFRKSDGSYMHVEDKGSFIYGDDGKALRMLGVIKNITDRITAAEERLELERRILYSQKMESLGIMAGGIAHDFNNLLMGVMGSLELAMISMDTGSDAYRNLQRAMNASKRASDITAQMLAYSGRGHFMKQPIDPADILAGMSDILRSSVNRTITLTFDIPPGLPQIQADPGQFQQVMMNLVSNASEAIGDGRGEIKITAGVERFTRKYLSKNRLDISLNPGNYLFIEVADSGCGMDDHVQKQIFEPFFSTKQTGRGLGMPAVQGIMRGHCGGLIIDSGKDAGTKVSILFPVIEEQKTDVPDYHNIEPAAGSEEPDKGLVLVIDDENLVRDLCIDFVKLLGLDAVGASDGEKGVEYFREHSDSVRCVLLDLSMPKMDGVTAFHEIKKIKPDIPVVLCSGYSEEDATKSFEGEGLAGFLQKPYRLESLKDKLKAVIKNHKFE